MTTIMALLDYLLQFLGREIIESWINRVSLFITKLLVRLPINWKIFSRNNQAFSKLVLLFRSDNFLVIDKPPDLLINSNDSNKVSVQTILRKQFPDLIDATLTHEFYFAHRLDFSTSGILCIPLNKRACMEVSKSFESRTSKKYYIALINGHMKQDFVTIDIHIGDDSRFETSSKKMCTLSDLEFCKNPRKSVTNIAVLQRGLYKERRATKVLIQPITGRRHQIRVHCQVFGHPIIGDYTYGLPEDKTTPRMFLHAIKLVVPNVIETIDIETKDPFSETSLSDWQPNTEVQSNLQDVYKLFNENI